MTARTCKVEQYGREAAALDKNFRTIDAFRASSQSSRGVKVVADKRMEEIEERLSFLEQAASYEKAQSFTAALFQMHVLATEIGAIESYAQEDGSIIPEAAEHTRRAQRLLYSVRDFIEQATGAKAEDVAGDHYMPRRCDPFRLIETSYHHAPPERATVHNDSERQPDGLVAHYVGEALDAFRRAGIRPSNRAEVITALINDRWAPALVLEHHQAVEAALNITLSGDQS